MKIDLTEAECNKIHNSILYDKAIKEIDLAELKFWNEKGDNDFLIAATERSIAEKAKLLSKFPYTVLNDCDQCDAEDCVVSEFQTLSFRYGINKTVTLEYQANLWTCNNCGFAYTADDAEDARMLAVHNFLERQT